MPRSSVHSFPSFYACYLLKSIKSPRATSTYIGSTPNPPRRIRQHNGELVQGAWKTKHHRPWVMQMIVHGFPSRLAALQFEWAWQHPYISRHLRHESGSPRFKRGMKGMRHNILVACGMVAAHPYNTWPLRVKLFTKEAHKLWNVAATSVNLPPGFTASVELEGVDGRSGEAGSGRTAPIDVTDSAFVQTHLRKTAGIPSNCLCTICHKQVHVVQQPLENALCPTDKCTAVSHLACLAEAFLGASRTSTGMIPRGGDCRSCGKFTLWGDIIRGCYRRDAGGAIVEEEEEDASPEERKSILDNEASDDATEDDLQIAVPNKKPSRRAKPSTGRPRGRPRKSITATTVTKRTHHTRAVRVRVTHLH
ncbi:hypothetical protein BC835DRAFT_1263322 [Cytidiella melzeri]|nr:hypothetical protein BC835DRAFT_1263322 [Cytidiella melzeri]